MQETTINIRLQATRADVLVQRGNTGKMVTTEDVHDLSDLVPVIRDALDQLDALDLPDIETSADDDWVPYAGYVGWEPPDTEWGWDEPDYQPPAAKQPKTKAKKATATKSAPTYQPPYHLIDAKGNRREITMMDPFDLQMKYQKANKKLSFDDLNEAKQVARSLLEEAGDTQITIQDKRGKSVEVVKARETAAV